MLPRIEICRIKICGETKKSLFIPSDTIGLGARGPGLRSSANLSLLRSTMFVALPAPDGVAGAEPPMYRGHQWGDAPIKVQRHRKKSAEGHINISVTLLVPTKNSADLERVAATHLKSAEFFVGTRRVT